MASKGMTIPGNMNMQIGPDTGLILLWNIVRSVLPSMYDHYPPMQTSCLIAIAMQSLVK